MPQRYRQPEYARTHGWRWCWTNCVGGVLGGLPYPTGDETQIGGLTTHPPFPRNWQQTYWQWTPWPLIGCWEGTLVGNCSVTTSISSYRLWTTLAVFHIAGCRPFAKHRAKSLDKGAHSTSAQVFKTLAGMLSGPVALEATSRCSSRCTVGERKWMLLMILCVRSRVGGIFLSVMSSWSRLHLEAKYWPKQFALSLLNTCSVPSGLLIVGKEEFRCSPPARLMVDHHCLSVRLPLASRSFNRVVCVTRARWSCAVQDRVACRALCRCWGEGAWVIRFHARCLGVTDSLHSGVHHDGSEGRETSAREGMNFLIPDRIRLVTLSHDWSGSPVIKDSQSLSL